MTSTDPQSAPTPPSASAAVPEPGESEGAVVSPWWRSAVVYQVYPRSFADSDGDGVGDLRGVTAHLDHLVRLGVDVVWLSPVYRSPGADNGYDISDYQDVDPTFGTLEDFDELLAAVHARGMTLLMDLVVNHTSDEHPWFVESRSSTDNPKRDWYWWRPARSGYVGGAPGAEPTNWASFFSGPSWSWDEVTGEYYLHLFDRKQPDLNWENPQVREAVFAMMRWWLDRGVDGFRMDVINLVSKDTSLPDVVAGPDGLGDGSAHYANGPRVHEFLAQMHREVFAGRSGRLLTVGEMPGVTWQEAVLFTDPARREVDMVFQFEHVGLDHGPGGKFDPVPLDLRALKESFGRWQRELGSRGWNSLYWDNHDQPRVVSRFGDDGAFWRESAKAWASVLHLHRGTPYVYQGEELGMTNAPFADIGAMRDVESLNHYRRAVAQGADPEVVMRGLRAMGRDNARTPMQWDAGPHAGFSSGTPWLPANPNHGWLNAQAQYEDPDSVFHHYRRLVELRHTMAVVREGDFTMLLPQDEQVYAFVRALGRERVVVVANLGGSPRRAEVDLTGARLLLSSYAVAEPGSGPEQPGGPLLRPWQADVYLVVD
ncbi:glycoside hydrolase family 13 protein [Cellulomonas soli]|uniref:Glucohydrolase n=1 Tax=Cellulomonas soli TaxID=931535 RepID=A0A512PAH2_9CELL|nr:alpha-glucosidase [Cellulomonas soli]NYI60695.1 oligo-1,6-glucosidase [Cellulomonas soli]GEP68210.1 glucohydrolase [Cellulomonas soli]